MKDIMLKITGKTVTQDEGSEKHENIMEFVTAGQLYRRGTTTFIRYPESELSGLEGCTTSLIITKDKVKMRRTGQALAADTEMEFKKGERFYGMYETPYGPIGMELLTNDVTGLQDVGEGKQALSIDYHISLRGFMEARNKLDIEITHPKEGVAQ
ncbi:MAG: DUF1934 domain-containing protein [Firmicutes bacterium]|nr:DUF1934 domain-containing protein [Bacillota bacterium]MBR3719438.1 DUF1934 domain-containing protein [Bacillota bacterium]